MRERRMARVFSDGSMDVYPRQLARNETLEEIFADCREDNERETDPANFVRVYWVTVETHEEIPGDVKANNVTPLRR